MKTKILILFAAVLSFVACENQDIEFDDFGTTAVYFPHQTPARCLILGEYDLGFNDNDNNHRFEIGVTMSGVYSNDVDRKVYYRLAPELLDGVANVQALPANYYTIEGESPVTIPAGSIKGRIPVQLTDAFFDDPLSFAGEDQVNYVIPLLITGMDGLDSLLTGVPLVSNPNRLIADNWQALPKDYTLYGIKFMNKYQGMYLRRGKDSFVGTTRLYTVATGDIVTTNIDDSSVYSQQYIEKDELAPVSTTGKAKAAVTNLVRRGSISSVGTVSVEMAFDGNDDCTVTNVVGDRQTVSGLGKWIEDGDEWGGKKRDAIYLQYQYHDVDTIYTTDADGNITHELYIDLQHEVSDTLVIRDRNVVFEQFNVELSDL